MEKDDKDYSKEVCRQVIDLLGGEPEKTYKITARNVYGDRWRVNIWTTREIETDCSISEAHYIEYSYFIRFNKELSQITSSDPNIETI